MTRALKRLARPVLYRAGAARLLHRLRNRRTLTVVMLHRVLPPDDPRWATADPRYTLTTAQLASCLRFFRRHYAPVSLDDVRRSVETGERLPDRALLVTFDDGWADTAQHARPLLEASGCPATVFVVSSAVGQREPFWQERVYAAWRRGERSRLARVWERAVGGPAPAGGAWTDESTVRALVAHLRALDAGARAAPVSELDGCWQEPDAFVSRAELDELASSPFVSVGGHGTTHEALAEADGGEREIAASRAALADLLPGTPIVAMSFPHGSYDAGLLAAARRSFDLVFTSDACLNRVGTRARVLGRVGLSAEEIAGPDGSVRDELLAFALFRRPHAALAAG